MKYDHLRQISEYLKKFQNISAIYRVDDNLIKIVFDKDDVLYFDMRRSNSKIFKSYEDIPRSKRYNAPFDIVLAKRFARSSIKSVALVAGDKILRFCCKQSLAYKEEITYLQFEFTGKHTNVIILDQDEVVLEALRHVDLFSSFREVKVGHKLLPPPKPNFTPKSYPLEDIESFLYDVYQKEEQKRLEILKQQKLKLLEKKLTKLQKALEALKSPKELLQKAQKYHEIADLLLSNLHTIKPYATKVELFDFERNQRVIELEKSFANPSEAPNYYYALAKKLKQKAQNIHIEKESLQSKIAYLQNFMEAVRSAKSVAKIKLLFPKRSKSKKEHQSDAVEIFFIEGYKVLVGKNQKGNIELLQSAKARDIWMHLKDRPGCHVLIKTDKQNLPKNILESAARLCVEFSTPLKDRFLVDYTPRREVKIQEGAHVLYNNYQTIEVDRRD